MTAKPKAGIGSVLTGLLSNPLTRRVLGPIVETALPKVRDKMGRRPLLALGGAAAGTAAAVQYLTVRGVKVPDKIGKPLGIGVMLAAMIAGQAAVTPVAAPRLTKAQAAKAIILGKG